MAQSKYTVALTTIALASAAVPAVAEEVDELTRVSEPHSDVSVGIGYNSDDLTTLGRYNGRRDDQFYPLLNFDINQRDDDTGTWTRVTGRNLGFSSRDVRWEQNRQGDWKYFIEYNQLESFSPYEFTTDLTGTGGDFQAVGGPTRERHFSQERKNVKIGMGKHFTDELNLTVSFRQENKDGDRPWGADRDNFIVEPIDYRTRELEAKLDYTTDALQLRGGYLMSVFDNPFEFVQLDDDTDGAADSTTATPPNNRSHSLYLTGGYNISDATRATFKLSKILDLQDEDFFEVNPTSGRTSLDGEIDTTRIDLGLISRVMPNLTLKGRLRYDDRDDETPQDIYASRTSGSGTTLYENQLTSRTIKTGQLDAIYRLEPGFTVTGGVEYQEYDRITTDVPNMAKRDETEEVTLKIGARKNLSETLSGSIRLSHSERDGSELVPGSADPEIFVAPIQWADRDREQLRLTLDWYATEVLSLQLVTEASHDDYSGAPLGPHEGNSLLVSLDAGYQLSDEWAMNAWVSTNRNELEQSTRTYSFSNRADSTQVWSGDAEDVGYAIGLGIKGETLDGIKAGGSLQYSHDDSKFDMTSIEAPADPASFPPPADSLPTITYKQLRLSLYSEYPLDEQQSLRIDYQYRLIKNDDWTWESYTEYPSTTVSQPDRESTHFIGLTYNYRYW